MYRSPQWPAITALLVRAFRLLPVASPARSQPEVMMSDRNAAFVTHLPKRLEGATVMRVGAGVVALHAVQNAEVLFDPAQQGGRGAGQCEGVDIAGSGGGEVARLEFKTSERIERLSRQQQITECHRLSVAPGATLPPSRSLRR
jgi:hypothetical protein